MRPRLSSDVPRPPSSLKKKSSGSATPYSDEDNPKSRQRLKSAARKSSGNDSSSGVWPVANGYGGFSSGAESGGENKGKEYISEL